LLSLIQGETPNREGRTDPGIKGGVGIEWGAGNSRVTQVVKKQTFGKRKREKGQGGKGGSDGKSVRSKSAAPKERATLNTKAI